MTTVANGPPMKVSRIATAKIVRLRFHLRIWVFWTGLALGAVSCTGEPRNTPPVVVIDPAGPLNAGFDQVVDLDGSGSYDSDPHLAEYYFADGCDLGADCDDSDVDNWTACASCADSNGDAYYADCDAYTKRQGGEGQ